jgi:iron complex outermembrane receptor protein
MILTPLRAAARVIIARVISSAVPALGRRRLPHSKTTSGVQLYHGRAPHSPISFRRTLRMRFPSLRRLGVLALAFVAAAAVPASLTAEPVMSPPVIGVVTDTAGLPLANVQVIVPALNRVTTTGSNGEFILRSLPGGTYHLTTILIGYAPGHADVTVPETGTAELRVRITMRPTAIQLSTIHVTATPVGTDPRSVTQATTELSGPALSRNIGSSVAQTLSAEPGVAMRYNGPAANTPVIRGLSGERVLVLQDGDRAGDLSATSPDHALSVDPLAVQRIEVVRGPASLLYGNNALGGVVNVISNDIPTSVPTHVEGYVGAQAESATPGGALTASFTLPAGESFALVARGGGRRVEDVRLGDGGTLVNTYYRNYYGVGGFGFAGQKVNGGMVYRGYRFDYGLPAAPDAEEAGVHIEGHRHEMSGRSDISLGRGLLTSIRLNGTAQWYTHDEIESSGDIGTRFNLTTQTADAVARTTIGAVAGAVGLSALFKQYDATGEEALTPAADSRSGGIFIYQEIPLGDVTNPDAMVPRLQIGGRYDVFRITSKTGEDKFGLGRTLDFNNASGSIGLSLPLGTNGSIAVSAARAFRAPTVEELFANAFHAASGTYDRGNPSLEAETNQGIDGILRMQSPRVNGQLAAFYSRIDNFITPDIVKDTTISEEDGDITVPLNLFSQADATLRGVEGRIEAEVVRHLVLGAMGDVVRGRFEGGEPLPFIPAARIGGLARWDDGRFSVGAEVRHALEQNRVPSAATADDPSAVITDAYTLVNLSAGLNVVTGGRTNSITMRIDNLLDERYFDAASRIKHFAPNPGRNFSLVYKVLF